uniref:Uncharacterized protein n=1 Tax=Streptomyces sp. NBC_00003 TaxID=2903608 RepID=A0AAU2VFW0_9ACTN
MTEDIAGRQVLGEEPTRWRKAFGRSGEWAYVVEAERSTWNLLFLDRLGQDTLIGQGHIRLPGPLPARAPVDLLYRRRRRIGFRRAG